MTHPLRVRFAVVGYGHIGKRHAALIQAHPGAELVAICDPTATPAADDAVVTAYRTLAELLVAGDFDVACICTPNGLHASQAIACLDRKHHVLIEKPLALTVTDCDAIIAAGRRNGRHVFGVMQNRYSPASAWLKQMMVHEAAGGVLQVHCDCFWNRDARYYRTSDGAPHPWHGDEALDGGVLFTQFAHFIDLLCWTCGSPEVRGVRLANQTHPGLHEFADTGSVLFDLGGGGMGTLNFSTVIWDSNFESTLTVIGERGTIKLGGQYMNELRYCHVEGIAAPAFPPSAPPNDYGPYRGSAANHGFVIDNVVEVLGGRQSVATTAGEGREVVRFIEAVHAWPRDGVAVGR